MNTKIVLHLLIKGPIIIKPSFELPNTIDITKATRYKNPRELTCNYRCPSCFNNIPESMKSIIYYKTIIKYHTNLLSKLKKKFKTITFPLSGAIISKVGRVGLGNLDQGNS